MKTLTELAKRVADEGYAPVLLHPEVWRLCELVAAAEREACAQECDAIHARHIEAYGDYFRETYASDCAAAIRARGEA